MTNTEIMRSPTYASLERDSFMNREHLIELAEVIVAAKWDVVGPVVDDDRSDMYDMIDAATKSGYDINNIEAIALLDAALDKRLYENQKESNIRDGTWDEDGNTILYEQPSAEDNTGEYND